MDDRSLTQPSRRAVFARALANRSLRRVLGAYLLFNIAEWANWIALLIWAYDRNGVRGASVIALLQLVPATLLAPWAATVSARLPRHRALTAGYAAQSVAYLSTGVMLAVGAPYVLVAFCAAAGAVTVTLTRPVHNALLPELADTTEELTAGNTASGTVEATAAFLGPLLSALIIVPWGSAGVLLANGVGAGTAVLLTARLHVAGRGTEGRAVAGQAQTAQLREVIGDRTARTFSAMIVAEYALIGMMDILYVVLAFQLLDLSAAGPGLLNSALGAGCVLGAALTATLVGRAHFARVLVIAAVATGIPIALAGQVSTAALAALLLGAAGVGKLFVDVASRTLIQRALPERMLVAVFGVHEAMMMGGMALGSLLAPVLVTTLGARWAFVAAGSLLPVVALASWWGLRDADRRAVVPSDVFDLLARVPMLAVLAPSTIERLARSAATETVPAGTVVIAEGAAGDLFHVIFRGRAVVTKQGKVLRELGPGDGFGEIALLRDVPRTATVTVTADTELVQLEREIFLTAVTGTPHAVQRAGDQAATYEH